MADDGNIMLTGFDNAVPLHHSNQNVRSLEEIMFTELEFQSTELVSGQQAALSSDIW